jgi:hypothetical protein
MGAGHAQLPPQKLHQQRAVLNLALDLLAVDL